MDTTTKKLINLTPEQQEKILKAWNDSPKESPPSLKDLVVLIFGGGFDGRSNEGRTIKAFLAIKNIKAKPSNVYEPKVLSLNLSEQQKEFIYNNATLMSPVEIAKILFKDESLSHLSAEARLVSAYIRTLPSHIEPTEDIKSWKPPKTSEQVVARINKYVLNGIDKSNINPKQQRDIDALMKFLHIHRLNIIINNYENERDRELFESSFVRFTYDKNDLTEEEVDQYISVCTDIVQHTRMQTELDNLTAIRDEITEDPDGKLSMSIVEALGKLYGEMDSNLKRQQKALETLNGKRNDRIKNKVKENASLISLVESWRNKTQRDKMIRLAEIKKTAREKEIDRIENMESVKASIFGISKEELLLDEL